MISDEAGHAQGDLHCGLSNAAVTRAGAQCSPFNTVPTLPKHPSLYAMHAEGSQT